jgi:hypothetical protein
MLPSIIRSTAHSEGFREKPSENRLVESGDASASYSFLVVCHTTV